MAGKDVAASARARVVKTVPVTLAGNEYQARVPNEMQLLVFLGDMEGSTGSSPTAMIHSIKRFLHGVLKEDGDYDEVMELIYDGEIDLTDLLGDPDDETDESGLLAQLTKEISGERPTTKSVESSAASSSPAGKRSTGRSPGKGSTRSTSRSTGS